MPFLGCSGAARPLPRGHDEHSQALRGGYLEHDQRAAGGTRRGKRSREHSHASGENMDVILDVDWISEGVVFDTSPPFVLLQTYSTLISSIFPET